MKEYTRVCNNFQKSETTAPNATIALHEQQQQKQQNQEQRRAPTLKTSDFAFTLLMYLAIIGCQIIIVTCIVLLSINWLCSGFCYILHPNATNGLATSSGFTNTTSFSMTPSFTKQYVPESIIDLFRRKDRDFINETTSSKCFMTLRPIIKLTGKDKNQPYDDKTLYDYPDQGGFPKYWMTWDRDLCLVNRSDMSYNETFIFIKKSGVYVVESSIEMNQLDVDKGNVSLFYHAIRLKYTHFSHRVAGGPYPPFYSNAIRDYNYFRAGDILGVQVYPFDYISSSRYKNVFIVYPL